MPRYTAPVRDMQFILHELLELDRHSALPGFSDASAETIDQILGEGAKFAENVLSPLNASGDRQGCRRHPDGSVQTPDGFPQAYARLVEAGWPLLSAEPEMGGQGLPHVVNIAWTEMVSASNMAFGMYPGLTHGAYQALMAGGSEAQKQAYGPRMASGEWAGTMNLTEPHCGTDLGLIRTRAVPSADGSYAITGQKIWISGGEQDLTENIIHLVLARIEGAPEGIKGISLFLVPKYLPDENGRPGVRNACQCGGLEEKMGIHGNATCVMNYDGATGWLVGEAHKGMRTMFVMMNEARLGVGLQGLAQAELAYQTARDFALTRAQGRALTGAQMPGQPADPIIVHPDVRRMLLEQKAFIEGARAFIYWMAFQADLQHKSPDPSVREKAGDYMALLTPVVKAYITHKGYESANLALQVLGGSGFTREWGLEQIVRDCRITLIYEGTNGVQALDLVGRKLAANGGRAMFSFFAEIDGFLSQIEAVEGSEPFAEGLRLVRGQLQEATMWLMQNGMNDFNNAAASSHDFLHLTGLTALAYMWARMACLALAAEPGRDSFYASKLATGHYFVDRLLPEGGACLARIRTGARAMMALEAAGF